MQLSHIFFQNSFWVVVIVIMDRWKEFEESWKYLCLSIFSFKLQYFLLSLKYSMCHDNTQFYFLPNCSQCGTSFVTLFTLFVSVFLKQHISSFEGTLIHFRQYSWLKSFKQGRTISSLLCFRFFAVSIFAVIFFAWN